MSSNYFNMLAPFDIPLLNSFVLAASLMSMVWLLSLLKKDASLVDRFWGLGFLALAVSASTKLEELSLTQNLLLSLLILWGLRLSGFIQWRNQGHDEDPRYQAMRAKRPTTFWIWSLFWVFLFQAFLMSLISSPVVYALSQANDQTVMPTLILGSLLFFIGFAFESIGDWQMARFRADPANKGQVNDRGLWALTRHPNYFGEALLWWGLYVTSAPLAPTWTILGPLLLTFLLLKVSGVSLLEKSLQKTKPKYADYMKRVPAFFPKLF